MRRLKTLLVLLALGVGFALLTPRPVPARPADPPSNSTFPTVGVAFLTKHCVSCHGEKNPKGEIRFHTTRDDLSVLKERKRWEKVIEVVKRGEMPPETRKKPTPEEAKAFVAAIQGVFDRYDRTAKRDPGRITSRRLNRIEYANTIRDLVGVDFDPTADFPADDIGYGFDNIGDVLSLSPILLERYLAAAETIVERAVLVEQPTPPSRRVAANFLSPRGSQREPRSRSLYAKGDAVFAQRPALPALTEDGEYIIRIRGPILPEKGKSLEFAVTVDDKVIKTFEMQTPLTFAAGKPPVVEIRHPLTQGERRIGVKMLSDYKVPDKPEEPPMRGIPPRDPGIHVTTIEVEGPLDYWPASHRKIMATRPGAAQAKKTREILTRFSTRAYRRPAAPEEVDRLCRLVETTQARGAKWEAAIQVGLQAILVSPKFLFRLELDDRPTSAETRALDDYALASRLSYFLWSTMPDEELLNLASRDQLKPNLEVQVVRMLKDPRSQALVDNFAIQWLQLRNLNTFTPDRKLFPEFDERLRKAMIEETKHFFAAIMREDRSLLDLIDADFTFVNGRLARHYGIDGVYGDEFRRVKLTDGLRGGVLTQASVLTVTSNPTRTSPVKRGKWVMEQILGTPPPEPPPNVPELAVDEKAQLTGALRQRMEQHRANPNCSVCHEHMDAMGFAFENFNAVGAFRKMDGNFPIDPSGTLMGGLKFNGPAGLKAILKGKKELFGRCMAEKMLTYALGRGLEYYDRATVDALVASLEKKDYRFSVLVTEIVKCDPFCLRRGNTPVAGK